MRIVLNPIGPIVRRHPNFFVTVHIYSEIKYKPNKEYIIPDALLRFANTNKDYSLPDDYLKLNAIDVLFITALIEISDNFR